MVRCAQSEHRGLPAALGGVVGVLDQQHVQLHLDEHQTVLQYHVRLLKRYEMRQTVAELHVIGVGVVSDVGTAIDMLILIVVEMMIVFYFEKYHNFLPLTETSQLPLMLFV